MFGLRYVLALDTCILCRVHFIEVNQAATYLKSGMNAQVNELNENDAKIGYVLTICRIKLPRVNKKFDNGILSKIKLPKETCTQIYV